MTLKRGMLIALVGVVLAAAAAQAGWYYQSGRWFYTPDVGTEVVYKGIPNPEAQPSYVIWTLTTERYGCACRNNGGNFASEVVSVENVTLTGFDAIDQNDILDKKKGLAKVTGHIDTETLCAPEKITCQNPNWYVDPEYDLVYAFKASSEAFLYDQKTGTYKSVSRQDFHCELSDLTASPLNLPDPGTPYNCF